MKFKSLFIAALAILAFSACDKKKDDVKPKDGDKQVVIQLESAVLNTRTFEAPVNNNAKTAIESGTVYFMVSGGAIVKTETLDVTAANSAPGQMISGVPATVNKVLVVANSSVDAPAAAVGTEKAAKEQKFNLITENVGPGVKNVTLIGDNTVGSAVGNTINVTVTLAPLTSRIELTGNLLTDATMTDVELELVALDNYNKIYKDATSKVAYKVTDPADVTLALADFPLQSVIGKANYDGDMKTKAKAAAYQAFEGETPYLLLKINYKVNGVQIEAPTFLTLKKISTLKDSDLTADDGSKLLKEIPTVAAGKIYKIDLAKIDWNGNGHYDDPTDPTTWKPKDPSKPVGPDNPLVGPDVLDPSIPGPHPHAGSKMVALIAQVVEWEAIEVVPAL